MTPAEGAERRDPTTHREVERKVRVPQELELPPLEGVGGVVAVERGEPFSLEAAYHDTEDVRLVRWGATLRRRTGGDDEGWHLKLPVEGAGAGVRDEIGLPLEAGEIGHVPAEIAGIVRALVREAPLLHLVTVRTTRTPYVLRDAHGEQRAELVDDRVEVVEGGEVVRTFREIEVEARGEDAEDVLDAVVDALVAAGGTPGTEGKGAAALGVRAAGAPDVVVPPPPGPKDPASDMLRALLADNVRKLLLEDVRVRRDLPDAVHQMRVAARTIRSALRTYAALVEEEWADLLRSELKATADALGPARDAEVHLARLEKHAASLPPEDTGLAVQAVDAWLRRRLEAGRRTALAQLETERHLRLLIELVASARVPRFTPEAGRPAEDVLPKRLKKAFRKLAKAVDRLAMDGPAEHWHKARIKAKRARYAAEAAAPVLGTGAKAWGKAFEQVTDLLGDQHDAVVAQQVLREMAAQDDVDGPTGYALGLLDRIEAQIEREDRERFADLWTSVRSTVSGTSLT